MVDEYKRYNKGFTRAYANFPVEYEGLYRRLIFDIAPSVLLFETSKILHVEDRVIDAALDRLNSLSKRRTNIPGRKAFLLRPENINYHFTFLFGHTFIEAVVDSNRKAILISGYGMKAVELSVRQLQLPLEDLV